MFDNLRFNVPQTAIAAMRKEPGLPNWSPMSNFKRLLGINWSKQVDVRKAWKRGKILSENETRQWKLRRTFGMIKCIDDNVGKLLAHLKNSGLEKDVIFVFTNDHGDSMGEHLRHNKLTPYDTSAGTSFIIRYPEKIAAGKVVRTA